MEMDMQITQKTSPRSHKWKKVLYQDQGVADNYVHSTFLFEMTKNVFVRTYDYWSLVNSSFVLTQQLCIVCLFFLAWWAMDAGNILPLSVISTSVTFSFFGYGVFIFINEVSCKSIQNKLKSDLKTALLLVCFTGFSSPVLKTLTHTISTDTIYAMATFMLLGHLIFHDYDSSALFASRALSLNMSVFAAVCLASRLETTLHTFVTVLLALQLFGLWPILRHRLWKQRPTFLQCITTIMALFVCIGLSLINLFSSVAFLLAIVSITFIFPAILVSLQPHKNNIHGPWDEAVIQD